MKSKLSLLLFSAVVMLSAFSGCNSSNTMTGQATTPKSGMEAGQMDKRMTPSMLPKMDGMMAADKKPMMDEKMAPKMTDPAEKN
jgi:hypothetical protein